MLAGVARIVEVSFVAPKYAPLPTDAASTDDSNSEHTLAEASSGSSALYQTVKAFRHLPPFVSRSHDPSFFDLDCFYKYIMMWGKCLGNFYWRDSKDELDNRLE